MVDDEDTLCEALRFNLEAQGYAVDTALSAEEALTLDLPSYSLIILDIMMGEISGTQLASILKRKASTAGIPIIFCTARDSEDDMIGGLDLGADDYVTKPYSPAVLIARIQSAIRRSAGGRDELIIEHKGVRLNVGAGTVSFGDGSTELTRNELRILHILMRNAGMVISRQEIMCELWESDAFIDDNTLTVNVNRLRKTLGSLGVPDGFLSTRRGQGYLV